VKLQHYARQHPRITVAVAVAVVLVVLYLNRPMLSAANAAKLANFPADEHAKFAALIHAFDQAGYDTIITSGYRPGEKGRHSAFRAIDVNVICRATGKQYMMHTSKAEWQATGLPLLAVQMGFRWGGNFTTPYVHNGTTYAGYDPVHFDLPLA